MKINYVSKLIFNMCIRRKNIYILFFSRKIRRQVNPHDFKRTARNPWRLLPIKPSLHSDVVVLDWETCVCVLGVSNQRNNLSTITVVQFSGRGRPNLTDQNSETQIDRKETNGIENQTIKPCVKDIIIFVLHSLTQEVGLHTKFWPFLTSYHLLLFCMIWKKEIYKWIILFNSFCF